MNRLPADWSALDTVPLVVLCDYCGHPAELVTGREVYPGIRTLHHKMLYRCLPCAAHVGCHEGTMRPLGRLANAELRAAKMAAHAAFDPVWRDERAMTRRGAYAWLAAQLGIPREDCHIGMFDAPQCRRVVEICERRAA